MHAVGELTGFAEDAAVANMTERVEIRRELAGLADDYQKARRKWARRRRGC